MISKILLSLVAGLAAGTASGQNAAPGAAAKEPEKPVVVLSPFEVTASGDSGYQARETLAGGRTRTSLDDIANSIDVITAELLQDTAAIDLQDIAAYGNNIDSGYFSETENSDGALTALWDRNTTYFRGFRTYRGTRNFMFTLMPFDFFSSDRLDLSKGPNAVLFGIGEPGGAINYNTKRATLTRDRNEVSLRVDDQGSIRGQADVDKVLFKDKLGFRAVLLADRTDFAWTPAYSNTDAAYLAANFRPTKKTGIRVNYESRNINRALGRRVHPRDSFTPYMDAGSPRIIAPITGNTARIEGTAAAVPLTSIGVNRNAQPRITIMEDGSVRNVLNTGTTGALSVNSEDNVEVRDGVYPKKTVIEGRNGISDARHTMIDATVEQELAQNLFVELSYADWTMKRNQANGTTQNVHVLQIDPNGSLPGSTTEPNPNFGRFYSEFNPQLVYRHERVKTIRGTLSYSFDLTKRHPWLGRHRFALMYENYRWREIWDYQRLTITGTPAGGPVNANLRNAQNRVWVRDYYDLASGDAYMRDVTNWYRTDIVDLGGGYTGQWLNIETGAAATKSNLTDSTARLGVWQGSWFDNLLNLTWGYRGIYQRNYNSRQQGYGAIDPVTQENVWRDPATGETRPPRQSGIPSEPYSVDDGIARNTGVVVKPLSWLSLTANHATNFNPSGGGADINGRISEAAFGETVDYGIRLRLWDGKVRFSALRYKTEASNLSASGPARDSPYANINSMYDILEINGVIPINPLETTGATNRVMFKQEATGYEFTLFAQPMRGLSLRMNAAKTRNIATDVGLEVIDYYEKVARPLFSNPAYAGLNNGGQTIAALLAAADLNLMQMRNYDGRRNPPSSTWTGNLNVRYSFDRDSLLRGFSVGGGTRWRDNALIGYRVNADATLDLGQPFHSPEDFTFDFFARYQRRLTKKINWSIQFNIRNLTNDLGFDGRKAINASSAPDAPVVITRYTSKDPRQFILTNTLSF